MSVKTSLIVQGAVVRNSAREVEIKQGARKGEKMTFQNMLVVGDNCMADLTLGFGVEPAPVGTFITGRVEVGVYRDDDNLTLVEYVEVVGAPAAGKRGE